MMKGTVLAGLIASAIPAALAVPASFSNAPELEPRWDQGPCGYLTAVCCISFPSECVKVEPLPPVPCLSSGYPGELYCCTVPEDLGLV